MDSGKIRRVIWFLMATLFILPAGLFAQEAAEPAMSADLSALYYAVDNLWLLIAAVLVFFMQAGFAMVEAGLNAPKNTVNILFKNLMDACIGIILFYIIGYNIMYPDMNPGGFFGFGGFGIPMTLAAEKTGAAVLHPQINFLFQAVFAATAATIVSGAVAGRMRFVSYLIYSVVITTFIYPISGMWTWGAGWLGEFGMNEAGKMISMGFHDFAGSVIVHSVGGFAGLAGAIVIGPRIGKFSPDGKSQAMPGHSLSLAALGVFILWVGWYGFNPGSQLAIAGVGNTEAVALVAVNTTLSGAAGALAAMLLTWALYKKPELSMTLNGVLAGLVGITANCDAVTNYESILIGLISGILVVLGVKLLDILKIDDPVGAWPVHGLAGMWGGIATGIFGGKDFLVQLLGSVVIPAWAFITMLIIFYILKMLKILRVSREDELKGLDISEHGEEAYRGFGIFTLE